MKRKKYIDILKCIAAFCVVMLHVNISSMHQVEGQLTFNHIGLSLGIHQVLNMMVSVFTILTGAGLLSSDKSGSYKTMFPYILKLVICSLLFGSIFGTANIVINHEAIDATTFIMDLINGTTWSHMWYLNSLIGLYLIMPVLKAFVERAGDRTVLAAIMIIFVFSLVIPEICKLIMVSYIDRFEINGAFVMYALAGYAIEKADMDKIKKAKVIAIIATVIGCIMLFFITFNNHEYYFMDTNPVLALTAIVLVIAAKGICGGSNSSGMLTKISGSLLGVYIIHPVFIHLLERFVPFNPQLYIPIVCVPIVSFVIYIVSIVVVLITRQLFLKKQC